MRSHGLPFSRQLRRGELVAVDTVMALILCLVCVLAAREASTGEHPVREAVWISWALAGAMALPLAVRRRWPVAVCAIVLAAAAAAVASSVVPDYAAVPASVTVAFAVYLVGLAAPVRASVITVCTCVSGLTLALLISSDSDWGGSDGTGVIASVLLVALGWLAGRATGERRANQARVALEQTARAVDEERLRIARELHDVVAHTMSLITVKASVANHVVDRRPAEAREALAVIEDTSRTALADIRRALGLLRSEPGSAAELAPAPGLADVPGLVERTAAAGIRVDLTMPPHDAPVPDGLGRTVYRIVQESLTNVVNHAGPATTCRAQVVVDRAEVRVSIVDDGRRALVTRGGHGIVGMRERVALYGGEFTAGPDEGGGFAVHARLPLAPA